MSYEFPQHIAVVSDLDLRRGVMKHLSDWARTIPKGWTHHLYENSLIVTSPDRKRILKIDSYKCYTLDVRQPDGGYKSVRFNCKTVEDACHMAEQVINTYKPTKCKPSTSLKLKSCSPTC